MRDPGVLLSTGDGPGQASQGLRGWSRQGAPPPKPCSETRTSGLLLPLRVRAEWVEEVQGVEPCVITSCRAGPREGTHGWDFWLQAPALPPP